jgi:DNA-binding NarL/FixJ family response regulator
MEGAMGVRSEAAFASEPLERGAELAALRESIAAARGGCGSVLVLEGAAGMGKSRLLQEAREMAHLEGVRLLHARCQELESALPWSLARALLAPALEAMTAAGRRRAFQRAGEQAAILLGSVFGPGDGAADGALGLTRARALTWLTLDLAEREPLVLAIDDLHWADESSLRYLAYLLPHVDGASLTVVFARRPRGPGAAREPLELPNPSNKDAVIEIKPLGAASVARLVTAALPDHDGVAMAAACMRATGGNPFYLGELLRDLARRCEEGEIPDPACVPGSAPEGVIRSVSRRLAHIGPDAVEFARAVAVMGDAVPLRHAAELACMQIDDAALALDGLVAAQILLAEDPVGFVHPLVAAAVNADIGVSGRGLLNLRAAQILNRDGVALSRVGLHLLAAGRRGDPWVVDTLRRAAAAALGEGAGELAADYLSRALEEPPDADQRAFVLGELGRIEASLGRAEAAQHLREALQFRDDPLERAQAMLELGRALVVTGDHARGASVLAEGVRTLEDTDSELSRELRAAWWMAASLDPAGRSETLAAAVPDIGAEEGPLSTGQRQLLAQLAQQRAFEGRSVEEVRELAERAWGHGELLRAESSDGMTWPLVTGALLIADELELEQQICDAALNDARLRGSPMAFATASYCRAWPLFLRGEVTESVADAESALAARSDGWATYLGATIAVLVIALLESGGAAEARAVLDSALNDPEVQRSTQFGLVAWANGHLLVAEHRPEEALQSLLQTGEFLARAGFDQPALIPWRTDAVLAATALGDIERAGLLAGDAIAVARAGGVPRIIAAALRVSARLARGEEAIALLREADGLLAASPPRLERLHVLIELGAALRRANHRAEARGPLQEGARLARSGGAARLAAFAAAELAAAGARPDRQPSDVEPALTPSEQRVASLAAEGHSNREIAQMLFVTVKAVEFHLGNTYSKLGIKRRGQLSGQLAGTSPEDRGDAPGS